MRSAAARKLCRALGLLAGLFALPVAAAESNQASLAKGEAQFRTSCGTCHAVQAGGPPRQGPNLATVIGRQAGSLPGFAYSPALADQDFVWDEAKLDAWITNAQAFLPGTTMNYRQTNPEKRALVIDYLKLLSP